MNVFNYKFPMYHGLESQYEHILYNYLDETLGKLGYIIKIKKTDFDNVDNALSRTKGSFLSCDAYIFANGEKQDIEENLRCLFELESTGRISAGLQQIKGYCELLSKKYKDKRYRSQISGIYAVVYDGEEIIAFYYDFQKDSISEIAGSVEKKKGEAMDETVKNKFFNLFPEITHISKAEELEEEALVKAIKRDLRASSDLINNKSALMTILAAIYGKTKQDSFENAVISLKENTDKEAYEIYTKWVQFSTKIDYEKNRETINDKLYKQAKRLWILSQAKKMDLYGFIYEELVETQKKQEDGEFYTSRHLIKPIISSVFHKYLQKNWRLTRENLAETLSEKRIVDPFCGSGGFLYEILKLLKQEYDLKDVHLNKIAQEACYGFDKNDIMAAYLNLYLVGDGRTNLVQVKTSINWQNIWRYEVVGDKAMPLSRKKGESEAEFKQRYRRIIGSYEETFLVFIRQLIDMKKMKKLFHINRPEIHSIEDFIEYHTAELNAHTPLEESKFWDGLMEEQPCTSDNSVLRYMYGLFLKYSENRHGLPGFDTFKDQLGCVDFIATNVPYGTANDIRFKTENTGTLESLALRECIDLLKPSTYSMRSFDEDTNTWREDPNGIPDSNNDGGIASIIIPNRILEGSNEKEIRDYLLKYCNILSVIKLPLYSFSPYATIQTFVLTIQKKAPFEFSEGRQKGKCFFYIVDNDGKANSNNRYATTLISDELTDIVNREGKLIGRLHEYLHDDFRVNIETYPEGFLSKLERAWIYGQRNTVAKNWNQIRYSSKWTGREWERILETQRKWGYVSLQKKTFIKEIEKKNKQAATLAEQIFDEGLPFAELETEEQKAQIERCFGRNLAAQLKELRLRVNGKEEMKVSLLADTRIRAASAIKEVIVQKYDTEEIRKHIKINGEYCIDIEELMGYSEDIHLWTDKIKDAKVIHDFLKEVESIQVEDGEVKFRIKDAYEQFVMVPEYYLGRHNEFMTAEEIFNTYIRLRQLQREC